MSIKFAEMTPAEVAFFEQKAAEAPPLSAEQIATLRLIFRPGPTADGYVRPEARGDQ